MTAAQITLGALLLGALAYTVLGYKGKYGALSGRSRLFRTLGLLLINLLLMLALMYTYLDFGVAENPRLASARFLFYFLSCLLVVVMLVFIAALDALETVVAGRREQRRFAQQMLREHEEQLHALRSSPPPPPPSGTDAAARS